MNKTYRPLLYILIGLILLAAVALFLFRDKVVSSLPTAEPVTLVPLASIGQAASSSLDVSTLQSAKLKTLRNYISKFNFDDICGRPEATAVIVSSPSPAATSTASSTIKTTPVGCSRGNGLPFFIKTE